MSSLLAESTHPSKGSAIPDELVHELRYVVRRYFDLIRPRTGKGGGK